MKLLFFSVVLSACLLLTGGSALASCAAVPAGGNYTVSASCSFAGTIDGVDNGGITINVDQILTVNAGQTVVWSPGSSITINGSIARSATGQLKKTYIWMTDADTDGYPVSSTMTAQTDTPGAGYRRRNALTSYSSLDYNDALGSVYPGTVCNGNCSINNTDGTCTAVAAGDNGLAACLTCNGSDLTAVNYATFADSVGNACAGTCAAYCSSGSCISTDTAAGTCTVATNARVASGGTGHCTSSSCVADYACGTETVTFTYKGSSVTYGTVTSGNSRCWLDRNLGASQVATSQTDTLAYGDYFQWGRLDDGHQTSTSGTTTTLSSTDNPGHNNWIIAPTTPYDWRTPPNNNLWQGVSGTNNPCPSGWRIPTTAEQHTEHLSWSSQDSAGAFASPLKLTLNGMRVCSPCAVYSTESVGTMWSSSYPHNWTDYLQYMSSYVNCGVDYLENPRSYGFGVRCIKD